MIALYESLTDAQLRELYSERNKQLTFRILENSPLARVAEARLAALIGPRDAKDADLTPDQRSHRKMLLPRIDFSQGIWAVVNSNGVPSCMLKGENWGCVF